MSDPLSRLPPLVAAVVAALIAAPSAAMASPFEDPSVGGAVFTGPASPHATSIYINPAALGIGIHGHHFYLGGTARIDQLSVDRRLIDPHSGATLPGPTATAAPLSPGGALSYYYVGERISGGISVHAPFAERFVDDSPALRFHSAGGDHYQWFASTGAAFRLTKRIYFGVGLSLAYSQLHLSLYRDTALEAGNDPTRGIDSDCGGTPCGFENPLAAQRYDIDVGTGKFTNIFDTKNVALSVGAAVEFIDGWWVAASFIEPPGGFDELDLPGEVTVHGAPRDGSVVREGNAEVTFRLPHTVYLGIRGLVSPQFDLLATVRWQNLSVHDALDIRFFGPELREGIDIPQWYQRYRGFQDTVQLAVGLERTPYTNLRYGARLLYETAAVDDEAVTPLAVAGQSISLGLGGQVRLAQHLVLTAGYNLAWHPEVTADPSAFDPMARLRCVDSGYAYDQCAAAREGRALPTAAGDYRKLSHSLMFSIRYDSL
ncbi:MAG TPA: outer membrane protein transport protein [Kofleriaceae bacterium]|nr:outer membrane protein transport protein [Kofleriaceae bacterium]